MRTALLAVLLLFGCKSSKKPAEAPPAKPAALPAITCSQAVPDAIKAKYFPDGKQTTDGDPMDVEGNKVTSCHYRDDKRLTAIDIRCGETFTNIESYLGSVESQVDVKYERLPNVGRGGYARQKPGKNELAFVHPSLPCLIDVEITADEPANVFDPKPLAMDIGNALGK